MNGLNQNAGTVLEAQAAECLAAIEDIKAAPRMEGCLSHEPMARGLIALLRVKHAEIEWTLDQAREAMERQKAQRNRALDLIVRWAPQLGAVLVAAFLAALGALGLKGGSAP